ncbi:MAG TPA: aminotransferase class I/II-fold pyridoxal phosphate-dependent enzyme [bacterium]
MRVETIIVHGEQHPDKITGAISPPIYQTSTFAFKSAEHGADLFQNEEAGYIYTRLRNPTTDLLARQIALLESAEAGLIFASGLAAIFATIITCVKSNEHIICDNTIYGGTYAQFKIVLPRLGIHTTFIDAAQNGEIERSIKPNTRLIFFETPANPTLKIIDIERCAEIAKKHQIYLCVDNTFATPYLQRPIQFGADVVVHSATKYFGGHGDIIGGAVVGKNDFIVRMQSEFAKHTGATMSPFNAWLVLRGLKTLAVRMDRHCLNAMEIADFLAAHPKVERVYYPGLPGHPGYEMAKKQMTNFGGMIGFDLKNGIEAGKKLMNSVRLCILAVSLGDIDTLIEHPASMTHVAYTEEELMRIGIKPGFVRLSVGLENINDLIDDLKQALDKI